MGSMARVISLARDKNEPNYRNYGPDWKTCLITGPGHMGGYFIHQIGNTNITLIAIQNFTN